MTNQPRWTQPATALRTGLLVCLMSLGLCGCKFGKLTNCYIDDVDCVNDASVVYLDRWYSPAFDLTRAGKPDWCRTVPRCVANRTCYTRKGVQDVPLPGYVVYPQPAELALDNSATDTPYSQSLDDLDLLLPVPEDPEPMSGAGE